MKLLILSDLHKEFEMEAGEICVRPDQIFEIGETEADVIILAGDIDKAGRGVEWAMKLNKPVIYVHGNHCYWGEKYPQLIQKSKLIAQGSNVHVLENDSVEIDGVRFLGCTLWTDFALHGRENRAWAMDNAHRRMNDYNRIKYTGHGGYSSLRPTNTLTAHEISVLWLQKQFAKPLKGFGTPFDGKTVVVTHHPPSPRFANPDRGDDLDSAYVSDLEDMVFESGADLWVCGHTHNNMQFKIGKTLLVSNSRGYVAYYEAPKFNPNLIMEI